MTEDTIIQPAKRLSDSASTVDDQADARHPVECLADRFIAELRSGSTPTVEKLASECPEHETSIRELFPTIRALEKLRNGCDTFRRGRASLGPFKPTRLSDFRLLHEIGRGGMGVVFEAEQESLRRRVAVKILPRALLADERRIERFQREAQTAAALHHTNIVPVFGVGEQDGFHFYVMQRIDGTGLDQLLRGLGPSGAAKESWPVPNTSRSMWAAKIGIQAAAALQYAHDRGVLHRDIKPANLLLDSQGNVWVTDFGLATALSDENRSATPEVAGTLRYMAPEQFTGRTDARSDLYSLGITLYEMLTGTPAFDNSLSSPGQRLNEPTPLRQLNPAVPRDLAAIVHKAIAPDPERRYQSAAGLCADLESFTSGLPVAARPVTFIERTWRWSKRNPVVAGLLTICSLLVTLIIIVATVDYFRIQRALAGETWARSAAERNLKVASDALDQIFARFTTGKNATLAAAGPWSESVDQPVLSQEVASLLNELVEYYDRLAVENSDNPVTLKSAAEARRAVGDIRHQLGQYEQAITAYEDADAMYRRLATTPAFAQVSQVECSLAIAQIQNGIGRSQQLLERPKEAREANHRALAALETISSDSMISPAIRYETARTYFLMARRVRPGMGPGALPPPETGVHSLPPPSMNRQNVEWLLKAIPILKDLSAEQPNNPSHRLLLAACYREQASDFLATRSAADHEADKAAIDSLEALSKEFPGSAVFRFELAQTLSEFSVFGSALNTENLSEAEGRLERALEHIESLVAEHPQVPEYATTLIHTHAKLASIHERQSELATAEKQQELLTEAERGFRRAIQGLTALVGRFPNSVGYSAWQAMFEERLGTLLRREKKLEESYNFLSRAVRHLHSLIEKTPNEPALIAQLVRTYHSLAETCDQQGDQAIAEAAHEMAREMSRRHDQFRDSPPPRRPPIPPRRFARPQ